MLLDQIKYYDELHIEAFIRFTDQTKRPPTDWETYSLLYLLSLNQATREHIEDLYDFKLHEIIPTGIHAEWQTSSSRRITYLAFNMFNNFKIYEDFESIHEIGYHFSMFEVLAYIDRDKVDYVLEGIRIRFNMI